MKKLKMEGWKNGKIEKSDRKNILNIKEELDK
jgi:hypothetical protein